MLLQDSANVCNSDVYSSGFCHSLNVCSAFSELFLQAGSLKREQGKRSFYLTPTCRNSTTTAWRDLSPHHGGCWELQWFLTCIYLCDSHEQPCLKFRGHSRKPTWLWLKNFLAIQSEFGYSCMLICLQFILWLKKSEQNNKFIFLIGKVVAYFSNDGIIIIFEIMVTTNFLFKSLITFCWPKIACWSHCHMIYISPC